MDVQRITETINGLVYRIEITPVAEDKWRAQLLRQHGGPTALMPFYGQTPEEAAKQAIENDVHIIGVSTQAAGHKTLVPMLIEALKHEQADIVIVVCGGIIPEKDVPDLESQGVGAVFGPGTNITEAALKVIKLIS